MDVWVVSVFISEGQLYPMGLMGTGGPGSPGQAASTTAEIFRGVAGSATETAPS